MNQSGLTDEERDLAKRQEKAKRAYMAHADNSSAGASAGDESSGGLNRLDVIGRGSVGVGLKDPDSGKLFFIRHDTLGTAYEAREAKKLAVARRWKKKGFLMSGYIAAILVALPVVFFLEPVALTRALDNTGFLIYTSVLVVAFGAMIWFADDLTATTKSTSFIDADDAVQRQKASAETEESWLSSFRKKFSMTLRPASDSKPDMSSEFLDDRLNPFEDESLVPVHRFEAYMREIVASLDSQINLSERKASILLDKGTSYIRNGIIFYVISIIAWQVFERNSILSPVAILGMVSCSLTFLVIEFLAAWFLRQYRSFVDASTHLIRVKSVFNRNLLAYFGMKEFSVDGDAETISKIRAELLGVLSQDIKWPDAQVGANGDFNHMMEMFDSLTKFVDKAKSLTKSTKAEA